MTRHEQDGFKTRTQAPEQTDESPERRRRQWQEENADRIRLWNAYVEKHGLPLDRYRAFRAECNKSTILRSP